VSLSLFILKKIIYLFVLIIKYIYIFFEKLIKLKNEKVPRVFIMIPDRKDWKKPAYVLNIV